jgi:outer membrane protein OmpA-like peptidoglycan-associated protein
MAIELGSTQGVCTAVLSGNLDEEEGQRLASSVMQTLPKGGKLVVDGSALTGLDQHGVLHLMAVQRWTSTPDRKRLLVAGFNSAVWTAIVENGGDFLFESKPTLAEALKVFGVSAPPVPAAPPKEAAVSSEAKAPLADAGQDLEQVWNRPKKTTPPPPSAPPTAQLPGDSSGWEKYAPKPSAPVKSKGFRGAAGMIGAVAGVLLLGIGLWFWLGHRGPEIKVSTSEVTAEEGGDEMDGVSVEVRRGRLIESSWANLPLGLYFEAPKTDTARNIYTLHGQAEAGAQSGAVQLKAESDDGGKTAGPVTLTIHVKKKPMAWQLNSLQSLALRAGQPIKAQSKFITGASEAPTAKGLPPGVQIELARGSTQDWQLSGAPSEAGKFPVTFSAQNENGHEEKSCTLEVAAAAPPPPENPNPNPTPAAAETAVAKPTAPVASDASGMDDGMRKFLLDRIENLPSRYTDADRENLRLVVNGLTQARLIQRVVFERDGQKEISAEALAKLKAALESPENKKLLGKSTCQIVIVGYASKKGSLASNVLISKLRAQAVDNALHSALGRDADLCGDYGPTNIVNQGSDDSNRVVEVYAGTLDLPAFLRPKAESFKQDFNRRHGIH